MGKRDRKSSTGLGEERVKLL